MALKSTSYRIEQREADAFHRFVKANGFKKERAIVAAILTFMRLPEHLRSLAIQGKFSLLTTHLQSRQIEP